MGKAIVVVLAIFLLLTDDVWSGKFSAKTMLETISTLGRQLMLQQFYVEEQTRSSGDSGLKQVRHNNEGTRPYHSDHFASGSIAAVHNHANNIRTIGMGELIAVLNGIEFRTRHNDYSLKMPHRTSSEYGATEDIPFPPVPRSVIQRVDVEEQVKEMRQYFKAWAEQNDTHRDYKPYFKPVLCYLEGAWTTTNKQIDEPFDSDRHHIDANTWLDLQEKVSFTSYTGNKNINENFAYLPTKIMGFLNETIPLLAQWNYRILCHPVKRDIPVNRFRVIDDLTSRMRYRRTYDDHANSRAARFQLNPYDTDKWNDGSDRHGLLDELMGEIPGMDNYQGKLSDTAFGMDAKPFDSTQPNLNAARYHRWYRVQRKDAMGLQVRSRGFADEHLFMAMTTQPKVAGMTYNNCKWKRGKGRICEELEQKWTYAIPLEIVYLTPLSRWNPYKLEYKGDARQPYGKTVNANGRNGVARPGKAFNGTNSKIFYQTPAEFFGKREASKDSADTTRKFAVSVLDPTGVVRKVRASGHRIFLPEIDGVGVLRQRYPIMPVHQDGDAVWKELQSLKDLVLHEDKYDILLKQNKNGGQSILLRTGESNSASRNHVHRLELSAFQVQQLRSGSRVNTDTELVLGHSHNLVIVYTRGRYIIRKCDNKRNCMDGHPNLLEIETM